VASNAGRTRRTRLPVGRADSAEQISQTRHHETTTWFPYRFLMMELRLREGT
jgi:hypothetical protein